MTPSSSHEKPVVPPRVDRPLTEAEKLLVFLEVTGNFPKRHAEAIRRGLCDTELRELLENHIGLMGGSCGPGRLSILYQGAGLKIWGSWIHQTYDDKPLFEGKATIAMARHTYGIVDPDNRQQSLF